MGKAKNKSAEPYLIDRYLANVCVRPLLGMNRLVMLKNRNRNGILHCDNVVSISHLITFSDANTRTSLYTIPARTVRPGFIEPRQSAAPGAIEADVRRLSDDGTEFEFTFAPKQGKTYGVGQDVYKLFEAGYNIAFQIPDHARVKRFEMTLDASAYLNSGYSVKKPRLERGNVEANQQRGDAPPARHRSLSATERGNGVWGWKIDYPAAGGIVWLAWNVELRNEARATKAIDVEKLATELSMNARLAKDLHNFVSICHYYAAGLRSLSQIGPEMITGKSVLKRSLEAIEETIQAELIERTKGKGLIRITPAGEAVLEWWSQFYMRWTPISPNLTAAK